MHTKTFENSSEKRVRRVLSFAVEGTRYWVNSQTPIEAIIEADVDDSDRERSMIRNGKFDFTIHRESASTAAWAVEYDGPTHNEPEQVQKDLVKNLICGKAKLPLLRIGYREDNDFLTARERLTPLEWLVRRWIAYESKIGELIRRSDQWVSQLTPDQLKTVTFEDVSPEFHFELDHRYPPLAAIARRLLDSFAIDVHLPWVNAERTSAPVTWRAITSWGGPLPDLNVGGFLSSHTCEVEVRSADSPSNGTVFLGRGAFTTRFAYPVRHGQRDPFDLMPPYTPESGAVVAAPPWGGSPARIGGEIAWYRALQQIEQWAQRNLAA